MLIKVHGTFPWQGHSKAETQPSCNKMKTCFKRFITFLHNENKLFSIGLVYIVIRNVNTYKKIN